MFSRFQFNILRFFIGLCLFGCFGYLATLYFTPTPITVSSSLISDTQKPATITVHISGAVHRPGVYTLPLDSRVIHLLEQAGPALETAHLDTLNLATQLVDGQHIVIPYAPNLTNTPSPKLSPIRINSASLDQLTQLPGVGPVLAESIIAARLAIGLIKTSDQLLDIRGIGPKKLAQILPYISFD